MTSAKVDVVNIVAVGEVEPEIDVEQVALDLDLPVSNFDPDYNATFLQFDQDGELIIMYTSGKYIIRGGNKFEETYELNELFLSKLSNLGIEINNPTIEIKNVVSVGDLETEVKLEPLAVSLGLEKTEYEPEQFPGMIYRPTESRCVLIIFASGKVVITAGTSEKEDQRVFDILKRKIDDLNFV